MKMLLSFLCTLISFSTIGAECTKKDLSDPSYLRSVGKENLIEHFQVPRHQDSVGWCGAYASADSLTMAVGEPVSALDVSINQYANINSRGTDLRSLNGISPNAASNVALKNGYCPESVIPSNQTSSSNLGHYALSKLMDSFQKLSDDFKAKGKPKDYCVTCGTKEYEDVIKPSLPGTSIKMVQDVLVKNDGDSLASLRELLNQLCAGNRKKADVKVKTHIRGRSLSSMKTVIDDALDEGAMPSIGMKASRFSSTVSEEHELVVIGRRPGRNGRCEYEIRNSWGRGCSNYNNVPLECNANKGTFWLDESEIASGVDDVIVITSNGTSKPVSTRRPIVLNETTPTPSDKKPVTRIESTNPVVRNNNENSRVNESQGSNNSYTSNEGNSSSSRTITNNSTNENESENAPVIQSSDDSSSGFAGFFKGLFSGLQSAISGLWQFLASFFTY